MLNIEREGERRVEAEQHAPVDIKYQQLYLVIFSCIYDLCTYCDIERGFKNAEFRSFNVINTILCFDVVIMTKV